MGNQRDTKMKLWLIRCDEIDGTEHHILIAARSMDDARAINYALRYLQAPTIGYKYDKDDIEMIDFKEIKEVDGYSDKIDSKEYIVKVIKKGRFYEWFNFRRD